MSQNATTPFNQLVDAGVYTITLPELVEDAYGIKYRFSNWENGSTNPQRVIDLTTGSIQILARYMAQQLLEINSTPFVGINFTLAQT